MVSGHCLPLTTLNSGSVQLNLSQGAASSPRIRGEVTAAAMQHPGSSAGKESACNAGDPGSDSWVGKFPWIMDRLSTPVFLGFLGGSEGKESACSAGDLGLIPGLGRSPGGRAWQPTPVFLPGESHGQRNLAGYSHAQSCFLEALWRSTFFIDASGGIWGQSLCPDGNDC